MEFAFGTKIGEKYFMSPLSILTFSPFIRFAKVACGWNLMPQLSSSAISLQDRCYGPVLPKMEFTNSPISHPLPDQLSAIYGTSNTVIFILRLFVTLPTHMVLGLPNVDTRHGICPACILGKQHHEPFPKHADRGATIPLAIVHLDLCGPMLVISLGDSAYFLLLIDNFNKFSWIYFLSHKDQALGHFQA